MDEPEAVPYIRVTADGIAQPSLTAYVARFVLYPLLALCPVVVAIFLYRDTLAEFIAAALGVLVVLGILLGVIVGTHSMRRAAIRFARSAHTSQMRADARFRIAQVFGSRGRRSLVAWVHRRKMPPLIGVGLKPDPKAFAEVQVDEEIEILSGARYYTTPRPLLFYPFVPGGTAKNVLFVVFIMVLSPMISGNFSANAPNLAKLIAVPFGVLILSIALLYLVLPQFRNAINSMKSRSCGISVYEKLLGTTLHATPAGITYARVGKRLQFKPKSGVCIFRLEEAQHRWSTINSLAASVRVSVLNERGEQWGRSLLGTDNPTIADLGARWLHGWRLLRDQQSEDQTTSTP